MPDARDDQQRISFSARESEHIQRLVRTGLWGETFSEVVHTMVLQGLQRAVADGLVRLP